MTAIGVAVAASLVPVRVADAQVIPPAVGRRCGFMSVTDPTVEDGETQTARIDGGPLGATTPGARISMTCTIQVGAANFAHAGADSPCRASSPATPGATVLLPYLCSYLSPDAQPVYLCTQISVDGIPYYWDGEARRWSTSSAVPCDQTIVPDGPYSLPFVCELAPLSPGVPSVVDIGPDSDLYVLGIWITDCGPYDNPLPGPFFPDPVLCPVLMDHHGGYGPVWFDPEDGDVYVYETDPTTGTGAWFRYWDCPSYGDRDATP